MSKGFKALGLAAVVAAGVLVPLYGDPAAPVTHPEWARMLLRALELEDNLPERASPRVLFSTLSWKESLAYAADAYVRGRGAEVVGGDGARTVVAGGDGAEVAYPLMVVRGGDYRLRVKMAGNPATPAAAEILPSGKTEPVEEFTLVPPLVAGWVEAGGTHLDRGAYTAAVVLPAGASLQRVEVTPPCLTPIEPAGGWKSEAVLLSEDAALTMLQALDLLSELPPAAPAIELTASDFRATSTIVAAATEDAALHGLWIKGGPRGLQALVIVDLPESGLYTLSVFGLFAGAQSWLADSCHKAILCPRLPAPALAPAWRPVMTALFAAGRHPFTVTLAAGAALGRVRIERKKDGPADAMATIERVGFDVGEAGPMPRAHAIAAMNFVKDRHALLAGSTCGDVAVPALVAGLASPASVRGPGATPGFTGEPPADVGVPLPGPVAGPPGPPATTPPGPAPSVTPEPPATVSPGPPPPTIPPQPPGSPVTLASPLPEP